MRHDVAPAPSAGRILRRIGNQRRLPDHRRMDLRIVLTLCLLLPLTAQAADDIFIYKQGNGARYYTDRKAMPFSGLTYIGHYGRPTAVLSCQGMNAAKLEARAAQYQELIDSNADNFGVDPKLVKAVMRTESCFDARAVSKVGARGLMQLMPGTASEMGVNNSFDPAQNIMGGVKYLSQMLQRFKQDYKLALAAYNAGPGAVERHKGIPPFRETQHYVKKVLESYRGR